MKRTFELYEVGQDKWYRFTEEEIMTLLSDSCFIERTYGYPRKKLSNKIKEVLEVKP